MVVWGSCNWLEPLMFRDGLRENPEACVAYEKLKSRLATEHDETRSYTAAESEFILANLGAMSDRCHAG
jgi:GrpB-like predicted nucleotidyltransferase (UPF0157 family)